MSLIWPLQNRRLAACFAKIFSKCHLRISACLYVLLLEFPIWIQTFQPPIFGHLASQHSYSSTYIHTNVQKNFSSHVMMSSCVNELLCVSYTLCSLHANYYFPFWPMLLLDYSSSSFRTFKTTIVLSFIWPVKIGITSSDFLACLLTWNQEN